MKTFLAIFIGGGLGSMLRYGLGKWIISNYNINFPIATLFVNIVACLCLGLIIRYSDSKYIFSHTTKQFWIIGVCGGFSTFSAFSNDTLAFIQQGHFSNLFVYVFASILLCLAAIYLGLIFAQRF